jgi:F-type H+-transporting ATPase subunit a
MSFAPIAMKVDLQEELTEQLNIDEVFSFKIGSATITFDECTVVSWIIIAVLTIIAILLTRNLKVEGEISKRQALLELVYEKAESFFKGIMGPKVEKYIPWLMSMALFIGASNIIGLFGFKPPTKSVQVTAAMAITSIVLIEYTSLKDKGFFGRIKAFSKPTAIITPINIMEVFTKPLSLCMRLFGNVIAAFTIMEMIKAVVPVVVPVVLSLYFDIFDGLLQAYIFVFLTALYLQEAVEEEEATPKEKKVKKSKKRKNKAIQSQKEVA